MAARLSRRGGAIRGVCLGLAATLIIMAVHWTPVGRMAEVRSLDLCFRYLPTLRPGEQVVHVDLDDKALEQIGRWPWPRRRLGQLVDVLSECGARAVALDIILPHPQQPRFVKEGVTDLYAADTSALVNPEAGAVMVLDDVELAEALTDKPNLYLAMHVDMIAPPSRPTPREQHIQRLTAAATTRPGITRGQAADEQGMDLAQIEQLMPTAKQRAFERRIGALLRDRPERPLRDVLEKLLGTDEPGGEDFEIARRAYLRQRALRVMRMRRFALPEGPLADARVPAGRVVPPLVTLANVIAHTGFVTVAPDDDGILRRVPLLVKTEQGVFPQLALAVAQDALTADHAGECGISAERGAVTLTCPDGFVRRVPVDGEGLLRVNWALSRLGGKTRKHISAVAAADVWQARENLRRNRNLFRLRCAEMTRIVAFAFEGRPLEEYFAQDDANWQELQRARLDRQAALLFNPADAPGPPSELRRRADELNGKIERGCRALIEFVDEQLKAADEAGGQPGEDELKIRRLRKRIRQIEEVNESIRLQVAGSVERLRKEVAGKICLVGSTSTGAADFVPTPIHERTPGVAVHAHVLETILSGRFARVAPLWLSSLLVLLAGGLVALITSTRGPIESAILLVAVIVGHILAVSVVWAVWSYWTAAAGPVAAGLLTFATIAVYRQLTEERQKRQVTKTFKQYLSPAMVDQLVIDPTQASLGGQRRQLTCLFSDLAGFTSLSERLGPEGTVNLLNRYLDRVGEVVQVQFGGTLSKYEGDGVFAFFGAPIPQDNHAARAMTAALDCQALLPEFNRELQQQQVLPPGGELSARIGIAAGEVFVGNMGSTARIAYTAIGDSVNVASRLETANKIFGTKILVNEDAWHAGGAGLLGRPMGRILVVGKTEPVAVWEPLARDGQADEDLRKLAEDFAGGVERYAAASFAEARDCFQAVLARRGDDGAARLYLRLCQEALSWPPDKKDFDGVIRLTEK